MNYRKRLLAYSGIIFIFVFMTGCRGSAPQPTRERLEDRVNGYITARQSRDLERLRQYFIDPNQARIGNIVYLKSRIEKISVNGNVALVELRNNFQAMGFTFKDVPQKLEWQWKNGDWYLQVNLGNNNPFLQKRSKEIKTREANGDIK